MPGDAAEVDHQGGGGDDLLVVELGVGGDDRRRRRRLGSAVVEVGRGELELGQLGDVGVVVGDLAAALAQQPRDLQRRRLARVADPGLVADAEEQDLASRAPACPPR